MPLIDSFRHTTADLRIWNVYAHADKTHACDTHLRQRHAESVNALIEFVSRGRMSYCGVSWGKDSVAVAHLLWCVARNVPLVHLRPTNHNPDCDAVRDYYLAKCPQPYHEIDVDYSDLSPHLTDSERDRQTDMRWYNAIRQAEKQFGDSHILGIRSSESAGRAFRMHKWGTTSPNACAPIGWWSTKDVFAYLTINDLPVHPAYAMLGGGRWPRERLRVAEIGDTHGKGGGRAEWEREYYGDILNRLSVGK